MADSRFVKAIGLLALIVFGALWFVDRGRSSERETQPVRRLGLDDADLLLYLEAVTRIRDNAVFIDEAETLRTIIRGTLQAYLAGRDDSSQYLSREDFHRFRESLNDGYIGIGMEISRERGGEVLSFPFPGGAAEKAGIRAGDRLVAVDGKSVEGWSLTEIASRARGDAGSIVELTVRAGNGPERRVRLRRERGLAESLSVSTVEDLEVIRLAYFAHDMQAKVSAQLAGWTDGTPLNLDLRGNGGGDLYAALDTAALFLNQGHTLARVRGRKGEQPFSAKAPRRYRFGRIYLWQDGQTASAAEAFIAALTDNGVATSVGARSRGKGTRQEILELSDGSALILTTGFLITPDGQEYHGVGLTPNLTVKSSASTDYAAAVKQAIARQPLVTAPGEIAK